MRRLAALALALAALLCGSPAQSQESRLPQGFDCKVSFDKKTGVALAELTPETADARMCLAPCNPDKKHIEQGTQKQAPITFRTAKERVRFECQPDGSAEQTPETKTLHRSTGSVFLLHISKPTSSSARILQSREGVKR